MTFFNCGSANSVESVLKKGAAMELVYARAIPGYLAARHWIQRNFGPKDI